MSSPLDPREDNWWDVGVNRREALWLGLSGVWSVIIFGWMAAWTSIGEQNPTGETLRVSPTRYQEKVNQYMDEAGRDEEGRIIPQGNDVYIGAVRYAWEGLPAVLEAGQTYNFHLGSYDVQHGLSIRQEEALSKQMSLQVLPGYEWIVEMEFDTPGTYHVVCNEFCGVGHRTMHDTFEVVE